MNFCPVTADLNRYLAQQELDDAYAAAVESKLDTMMEESSEVAEALDDIIGSSDVGSDGCTMFAGDLTSVLMASDAAFEADAIRYFRDLRDRVREQMRDRAESLVNAEIEQSKDAAEEAAYEAREEARDWGDY